MDFQILYHLKALHTPFFDGFFKIFTAVGQAGILWIALGVYFAAKKNTRTMGFTLLTGLLLCLLLGNITLKPLVGRYRPCHISGDFSHFIPCPKDFSFPSGHTLSSFTAAWPVVFSSERKLTRMGFLIVAALVSFSRLYFGVHFPTDVFAGFLLSLPLYALAKYLVNRFFPTGKKEMNLEK